MGFPGFAPGNLVAAALDAVPEDAVACGFMVAE
jgi:hypothetical protein